MTDDINDPDEAHGVSHFQNYSEYSKTLRAWLVAYGVGGPVLLLTNDKLAERVAKSGEGADVVALFLFGVGIQVVLSFLNKWAAWHLYRGSGDSQFQKNRSYKFWFSVNQQSWLDITVDLASLITLGIATARVLYVVLSWKTA